MFDQISRFENIIVTWHLYSSGYWHVTECFTHTALLRASGYALSMLINTITAWRHPHLLEVSPHHRRTARCSFVPLNLAGQPADSSHLFLSNQFRPIAWRHFLLKKGLSPGKLFRSAFLSCLETCWRRTADRESPPMTDCCHKNQLISIIAAVKRNLNGATFWRITMIILLNLNTEEHFDNSYKC